MTFQESVSRVPEWMVVPLTKVICVVDKKEENGGVYNKFNLKRISTTDLKNVLIGHRS